jgi:hypothetical protein
MEHKTMGTTSGDRLDTDLINVRIALKILQDSMKQVYNTHEHNEAISRYTRTICQYHLAMIEYSIRLYDHALHNPLNINPDNQE